MRPVSTKLRIGAGAAAVLAAVVVWFPPAMAAAATSSTTAVDCGNGFTMTPGSRQVGFDPAVASDAQLNAQDFPSRPDDPELLAAWQGYVAAYNAGTVDFGGKDCGLSEDPTVDNAMADPVDNATSSSWCGWVDNGHTYTDAEAIWIVPRASGGSGAYSSHWAGVGLGNSSAYPLVQAGSESRGSGYSYGWIQIYPQTHELPLSDFVGIAGHALSVHVTFHTNIGYFHVVDMTAHIDRHYNRGFTGRPDGHAEFIGERPLISGKRPPLANFGRMVFTKAQTAAPDTGWRPVLKQPKYSLTMVNGSHTLAVAGPGDSTGLGYSVNWRAAS